MARFVLNLYIDESGNFEADDRATKASVSLVGGLLCDPNYLTDQKVKELLPERVHCCMLYIQS